PKHTPAEIVQKLHGAAVATMEAPSVRQRLKDIGADVVSPERRSSEYLQKFVEAQVEKWATLIRDAGFISQYRSVKVLKLAARPQTAGSPPILILHHLHARPMRSEKLSRELVVNDLSVDNGEHGLDLLQLLVANLHVVFVQNDEICELAALDRSQPGLHV